MKRILIVALALSLAGCAGTVDKINSVYTAVTSPTTIYQVKNAYAAGDQLVIDYRKYCWSKPYAAIVTDPVAKPLCQNRRAIVRTAQSARAKASAAIKQAEAFIASNPTLNAGSVISAARSAVTAYRNTVPN